MIFTLLPSLASSVNSLYTETLQRRAHFGSLVQTKQHAFRAPPRVTLNEAKLAAYVRELADPSVPLIRLSRNVPHGFRGERLLEMLWLGSVPPSTTNAASSASAGAVSRTKGAPEVLASPRSVEIGRALWFIQSVGASDIASRSRSTANQASTQLSSGSASLSASYTVDFTNTCTSWLKRQLAELNFIDESGQPGTMNKATDAAHKKEETTQQWVSKWRWSMLLMSTLLANSLLDSRAWCTFLVEAVHSATLSQLAVVLSLVRDWVDDIVAGSALLTSRLLAATCRHIRTVEPLKDNAFSEDILTALHRVLVRAWLVAPESFVSQQIWLKHEDVLVKHLLLDHEQDRRRRQQLLEVRRRSLQQLSISDNKSKSLAEHQTELLEALDEFSATHDWKRSLAAAMAFLRAAGGGPIVMTLMQWGSTNERPSTNSGWRQILTARLLSSLSMEQQASRRKRRRLQASEKDTSPDISREVSLWLQRVDSDDSQREKVDFDSLVALFDELGRVSLFSFHRFLHSLTARGLAFSSSTVTTTLEPSAAPSGLQVRLLRALPLRQASASLMHQRRLAIYGPRPKETREEAILRRSLRELEGTLAALAGHAQVMSQNPSTTAEMNASFPHLWQASRFTAQRIVEGNLLPAGLNWLRSSSHPLDIQVTSLLATILGKLRDWRSLCEILTAILERVADSPKQADAEVLRLVRNAVAVGLTNFAALQGHSKLITAMRRAAAAANNPDTGLTNAAESKSHDLVSALEALDRAILVVEHHNESLSRQNGQLDEVVADRRTNHSGKTVTRGVLENLLAAFGTEQDALLATRFQRWVDSGLEATDLAASTLNSTQIVIDAVAEQCLELPLVIEVLILPALEVLRDSAYQRLRPIALNVLKAVLLDTFSMPLTASLAVTAQLSRTPAPLLVRVAANVAVISTRPGVAGNEALSEVVQSILVLPCVADKIVSEPALLGDIMSAALQGIWSDRWPALTLYFDAAQVTCAHQTLLLRGPSVLDLDTGDILARMNVQQASLAIEEIRFVLEALSTVEVGLQARADAKVAKLAQSLFPHCCMDAEGNVVPSHGLRLWQVGTRAFRTALLETGMQRMLDSLEKGDYDATESVAIGLKQILVHGCEDLCFPATSMEHPERLFEHVAHILQDATQWRSNVVSVSLTALYLLSRLPAFWTTNFVREGLGRLFVSLVQCLFTAMSKDNASLQDLPDASDMHEVLVYILSELPSDILPCIAGPLQTASPLDGLFDERVLSSQDAKRITRLLPIGPLNGSDTNDMVFASSLERALEHGEYSEAPERPWNWTEPLEAVSTPTLNASSLANGTNAIASLRAQGLQHAKFSSPFTMPPLANNTSLSIAHFGPVRSTMLIPDPAADHLAKESVRSGYPQASAGDDEAEGWRTIRTERRSFWGDESEPTDQGKRLIAKRVTTPTQELSELVGLPSGPVRTLSGYFVPRASNVDGKYANTPSLGWAMQNKKRGRAKPDESGPSTSTSTAEESTQSGATAASSSTKKRKGSVAGTSGGVAEGRRRSVNKGDGGSRDETAGTSRSKGGRGGGGG